VAEDAIVIGGVDLADPDTFVSGVPLPCRGPVTAADRYRADAALYQSVTVFVRTATKDTELRGIPVKSGERAAMFFRRPTATKPDSPIPTALTSAELPTRTWPSVVAGPISPSREPRPRGGQRIIPEVLSRMDLELAGPVERVRSTLMNGIYSMPVRFTPSRLRAR
jgi:hypothetical protein